MRREKEAADSIVSYSTPAAIATRQINRHDSPDSLAAAIRDFNTPAALPVFTIADLDSFGASREHEERVLVAFYDYLFRIDEVRGRGRLYLP